MFLLYWLDEKIIYLLEKFCHKFQLWTGKTNFFLARVVIVIFFGSILIDFLTGIFEAKSWGISLIYLFLSIVWLLIALPIYVKMTDFAEDTVISSVANGYRNQSKINPKMRSARIFIFWFTSVFVNFLTFLWGDKFYWYNLTASISLISIFYLLACDPMPPCRSSIKKFFSSWFANPMPISSKS